MYKEEFNLYKWGGFNLDGVNLDGVNLDKCDILMNKILENQSSLDEEFRFDLFFEIVVTILKVVDS